MTPETIKAAFDEENWSTTGYRDAGTLQRILTRILCPAPAARPDSAGEGGKDRPATCGPSLYLAAKAVCEAMGRSAMEAGTFEKICAIISTYGDERDAALSAWLAAKGEAK